MDNPRFIQLGHRIFAVDHIVAINLNYPASLSGDFGAVALYMSHSHEPFLFYHETPEAAALTGWAQTVVHTQALSLPLASSDSDSTK